MSRVIYEELQDKEGNIHYLHTEDKVVFDENGQSLRAAMKEVQFEDYTGTAELPSVETAVAGITRGRKWTDLFGNIKAALKGLKAKDEAIEGSMGDAFSKEKSYAVGDYAIYKDVLYKFTAAKTAGSWDVAKVQAVTVVGEVCSLNGNISSHNHDNRYYTENEIDNLLGQIPKIRYGLVTISVKSIKSDWYKSTYISFGETFTEMPAIILTQMTSIGIPVPFTALDASKDGFHAGVYTKAQQDYDLKVSWIAVGH